MTAIEHIKAARQSKLIGENRKQVSLDLSPPLPLEQIKALEQSVGQPLPEELRGLLAFCSGIDGCVAEIDFTGSMMAAFESKEIFPNGLPIAADGWGNFWVLDLTPQTTQVAPVFYACHDAPVILYQSADVASFLSELFRMYTPPHKSLVDDVLKDSLFEVWRRNPGVIDQSTAASSTDAALHSFASGLPGHFQIIDLRQVDPGMGFSWGRYGPTTETRRHGYERIFAYAKPPSKPSTGFFAKLFGR
jgi:cell wall assembly regulator SMI1